MSIIPHLVVFLIIATAVTDYFFASKSIGYSFTAAGPGALHRDTTALVPPFRALSRSYSLVHVVTLQGHKLETTRDGKVP